MLRLVIGQPAPTFVINDVNGTPIDLEAFRGEYTLISFFRYAGCPFCNLTLLQLIKRYENFSSRGLKIITFFQSPADTVSEYVSIKKPPFAVIPDPDKTVYDTYGIESSAAKSFGAVTLVPGVLRAALSGQVKQGTIDGDAFLMPAQFIVGPDLNLLKVHYGNNWGDKMSMFDIEEVLLRRPAAQV